MKPKNDSYGLCVCVRFFFDFFCICSSSSSFSFSFFVCSCCTEKMLFAMNDIAYKIINMQLCSFFPSSFCCNFFFLLFGVGNCVYFFPFLIFDFFLVDLQ